MPIMVAGDFNGNASAVNTDEEFRDLYSGTNLKDVLDVHPLPLKRERLFIRSAMAHGLRGVRSILPFYPRLYRRLVKPGSSRVHRYKDEFGMEHDVPRSMDAKLSLPSDHYPLVFEVENLKIK